ncbi:hypothetical protein OS493_029013 [Desmophyllum pertusum]|uniref:Uncharacterized protein n=1 Tax=Desmophyllum pertusum TaxID=174260 RepID=A0A9W9YWR3_9CNID|nr:hypothetical protein OS493_029013 [Desmophyllum pertusum]
MKFNFCKKLLFVLFACMFLLNQTLGKPYAFQEQDEAEQSFPEEKRELNQTTQNGVRGKREVTYNMTDICQVPHHLSSPSAYGFGCVKGNYFCGSYKEAVCNKANFQCLSSIPTYDYPKCTPVYDFVRISGRKVRRTKTCRCA